MTAELKKNLDELVLLIEHWNTGKLATEEEFIDKLRPIVLQVKKEIEKPSGEQQKVV